MIFFRLPLQKPSPEHGETGEGFQNGEDIKNLNLHAVRYSYYMQHMTAITCSTLQLLHAAHYCYYIQLVTPSDAATAVTIDNKI